MNPFKHYRESYIIKDVVKNKHIKAGRHSYYAGFHHGVHFEDNVLYLDSIDHKKYRPGEIDGLIIGNFCSIASGAKFMLCGTQGHNYNFIAAHPLCGFVDDNFPGHERKGNTVIGNDVWIGYDSLIMPGVHVADGAVIAARSVITKDIGPFEIWGGNPAKLIKKRFTDQEIEILLQIKWWDWSDDKITKHIEILRSSQIEELWKKYINNEL
jgi:chloramphenicol O-acetyltransferase type B